MEELGFVRLIKGCSFGMVLGISLVSCCNMVVGIILVSGCCVSGEVGSCLLLVWVVLVMIFCRVVLFVNVGFELIILFVVFFIICLSGVRLLFMIGI